MTVHVFRIETGALPTETTDLTRLHLALAEFGRARMSPTLPTPSWRDDILAETDQRLVEGAFVERERAAVQPLLADLPMQASAFIAWYEALRLRAPGQGDPLFPWLAERADLQAMRWFIEQEAAGEAGFDDLVALTQVKLPEAAKLELARNYWDEMGRGNPRGMHAPMLETLVKALKLTPQPQTTVWQSLALGNLMTALATNRRYAFHSVGALGAIEMTAPDRAEAVAKGLARLGLDKASRRYFDLHAVLDRKHSADWNREAISSLVETDPVLARPIAEGALMRLAAGARCFERYREEFDLVS
jgi:Iron-containing redox enzyme